MRAMNGVAARRALRIGGLGFRALGLVMLGVGIVSLALGPLEMVCFTWFEEGGRFAYEGFGFGSFMFGSMAMQILGYYSIAALLIPLGVAHLRLRRWARTVTQALVWCWVVLGVPLLVVFLAILLGTKELSPASGTIAAVVGTLSYVALPGLLMALYGSDLARATFDADGHALSDEIEGLGVRVLVVALLEAFWAVALHVLLFFGGLFPILTGWVTDLPGYALVDASILSLLVVIWGTVRRRAWAWWAAVIYFIGMTVLWVGTLATTTWPGLLAVLSFPAYEVDLLDGVPAQGWHFALLVGLPLAGTLVALGRACITWRAASQT